MVKFELSCINFGIIADFSQGVGMFMKLSSRIISMTMSGVSDDSKDRIEKVKQICKGLQEHGVDQCYFCPRNMVRAKFSKNLNSFDGNFNTHNFHDKDEDFSKQVRLEVDNFY